MLSHEASVSAHIQVGLLDHSAMQGGAAISERPGADLRRLGYWYGRLGVGAADSEGCNFICSLQPALAGP